MQVTKKLLGFTLVELIVVITIVGILSTVGFVSYSGYLTGARDSNRISQLTKLSDSLQVYAATKSLPLPDNYIEVTASGSVIGYQGYVGVDVLETIDFTNGGKDPKDDSYFTYYLSKDRNSLQLLALMEEQGSLARLNANKTHAATYEDRYPKVYGKKLGVLTQVDTNTPAQEITGVTTVDIVTTTDNYVSHISDTEKLEGAGAVLRSAVPNGNCRRLKQMGKSRGNGTYTINPGGTGDITAYCEMDTAGGGWTLVSRSTKDGTGAFGWNTQLGSVDDDTASYSMGTTWQSIPFSEVLLTGYSSKKDIDNFTYKYSITDTNLLSYTSSAPLSSCTDIKKFEGKINDQGTSSPLVGCAAFGRMGHINNATVYTLSSVGNDDGYGLRVDGIHKHHSYSGSDFWNSYRLAGDYAGQGNTKVQGMIFVK